MDCDACQGVGKTVKPYIIIDPNTGDQEINWATADCGKCFGQGAVSGGDQ